MKLVALPLCLATAAPVLAQVPSHEDLRLHAIVDSVAANRIEADVATLVSFGTRNTLSDTLSDARGPTLDQGRVRPNLARLWGGVWRYSTYPRSIHPRGVSPTLPTS